MKESAQCVVMMVSMLVIAWFVRPYLEHAPSNVKLAVVLGLASILVGGANLFCARLYRRIQQKKLDAMTKE